MCNHRSEFILANPSDKGSHGSKYRNLVILSFIAGSLLSRRIEKQPTREMAMLI